tara:strand:+ start:367 stop:678 length:312 start_codon:yes stop_codon:yes gene_type:complete
MFILVFSLLFTSCTISNNTPSSKYQEVQIHSELEHLSEQTQYILELSHKLESEIDEVRRNSKPNSAEAIEMLELQVKNLRKEQSKLQEQFTAWKLQLIPENSK